MARFHLDKEIAGWRHGLVRNRAFLADDLDELEAHLRDHIDTLMASGHSAESAFRVAVDRLGAFEDLETEYRKVRLGRSKRKRNLLRDLSWESLMLKNHLRIALRRVRSRPGFAVINLVGLAVGLACAGLIGLHVHDAWRYDRFHEHGDRVYRVVTDASQAGGDMDRTHTVARAVPEALATQFPEIEAVVPFLTTRPRTKHEGQYFFERSLYAGARFFDVFGFRLLEGDPATALREPYSIVMTEGTAQKYFGDRPALGETIALNDTLLFTVTGIAVEPPPSHIAFDQLLSFSTFEARGGDTSQWFTWDTYAYVLLHEGTDPAAFQAKIADLTYTNNRDQFDEFGYYVENHIEPLPDIYLHAGGSSLGPSGSAEALYLLGAIALFVLLIAGVNFVNLSTALSVERAKEIGVRKTVGAERAGLVGQFLFESTGTVLAAGILAIGMLWPALPAYNALMDTSLTMQPLLQPGGWLVALALLLCVGASAGAYPAFLLSRVRPVETLKGAFRTGRRSVRLRQSLVVFQFATSILLIAATLVVARQLAYMRAQRLAFEHEHVLVVDTRNTPRRVFVEGLETIKERFAAQPGVLSVTAAGALPGYNGWQGQVVKPEGTAEGDAYTMEVVIVDPDFVETLGLDVVAGRDLSYAFESDRTGTVLLNEAAARAMGRTPDQTVGLRLWTSGREPGEVVGVVQDYHHHGLQQAIKPQVYFVFPWSTNYVALRLRPDAVPDAINDVEAVWAERFPGYAFEYTFLDEAFDRQYQDEARLARLFGILAGLAVGVACLGLLGLAAFTAQVRTKEIGIRKALGASIPSIASLLAGDFLKLVLVACVVAFPIAYLLMQRWLEEFAYRVDPSVGTFALAGSAAFAVALLTVSYQAVKAAVRPPVESLRYE